MNEQLILLCTLIFKMSIYIKMLILGQKKRREKRNNSVCLYIENGTKYSFQYIRKNEKKKITELKGEIFIHDVNVAVMVSLIRLSSG